MIQCVIIEDNSLHSENLVELLKKASAPINVRTICTNVLDAFNTIQRLKPELIFLDIEMELRESGFDLLKMFNKLDFAVIFTSRHSDKNTLLYAIKACRACDLDFLCKPIKLGELDDSITHYIENKKNAIEQISALKTNLESENEKIKEIIIRNLDAQTKIETDNIMYCTSFNSYTHFFLQSPVSGLSKYTSSKPIKFYEECLMNSSICRTHNEHLVNLKFIIKIIHNLDGALAIMGNGKKLPVSRSRKKMVLERWKKYHKHSF